MKYVKYKICIAVCLSLWFAGCTSTRKVSKSTQPEQKAIEKEVAEVIEKHVDVLDKIQDNNLKFTSFYAKSTVVFVNNGKKQTTDAIIRIKQGEKIWISVVPALGIEIARLMVTPDSVYYLNRLERVFLKKPFTHISQMLKKNMDYHMLESLLIGNDFSGFNLIPHTIISDNENYTISFENRMPKTSTLSAKNISFNIPLQQLVADVNNYKIKQNSVAEKINNTKFVVFYKNFKMEGLQLVPQDISMWIDTEGNRYEISIQYNKIQLNQSQNYPFAIPSSYKEIQNL